MTSPIETLHQSISALMSPLRFEHVKRVAIEAGRLASAHGVNVEKASLAGLIHDSAKELSPKHLKESGVSLNNLQEDLYQQYPAVWHALVAADAIPALLNIHDTEVLAACKWHTTGKAQMSPLEQVVFVADAIEPGRKGDALPFLRKVAYESLDEAVFALSWLTFKKLEQKGRAIHPESQDCLAFYERAIPNDKKQNMLNSLQKF